MTLDARLEQMLNEQMRNEFYSAYLYLTMQTWFDSRGLDGFKNWYEVQVKEERDHALGIRNFIYKADGTPEFLTIEEPDRDFKGVMDILQRTLAHEQLVTAKINDLMETAQDVKDYKTILFLQWYVTEQVEEEENVRNLIHRFKLAEASDAGILIMDGELEKRQYEPVKIPV